MVREDEERRYSDSHSFAHDRFMLTSSISIDRQVLLPLPLVEIFEPFRRLQGSETLI